MAEERVLDVREIATLVTTLYADRLPASSSSSGVPAQRTSTGVSESSEEHGVVLIRDSSLKSDEAWTERGCSFGSGASGSTSAVPRCGTSNRASKLAVVYPPLAHHIGPRGLQICHGPRA